MFDFDGVREYHRQIDAEFARLSAEPCQRAPEVGDRVLVAGGLLGMGHMWVRIEGEVLDVADTSCRVRLDREWKGEKQVHWVHNVLITDVLGPKQREA